MHWKLWGCLEEPRKSSLTSLLIIVSDLTIISLRKVPKQGPQNRSLVETRARKMEEGAQCASDQNVPSGGECVNCDRKSL